MKTHQQLLRHGLLAIDLNGDGRTDLAVVSMVYQDLDVPSRVSGFCVVAVRCQ